MKSVRRSLIILFVQVSSLIIASNHKNKLKTFSLLFLLRRSTFLGLLCFLRSWLILYPSVSNLCCLHRKFNFEEVSINSYCVLALHPLVHNLVLLTVTPAYRQFIIIRVRSALELHPKSVSEVRSEECLLMLQNHATSVSKFTLNSWLLHETVDDPLKKKDPCVITVFRMSPVEYVLFLWSGYMMNPHFSFMFYSSFVFEFLKRKRKAVTCGVHPSAIHNNFE